MLREIRNAQGERLDVSFSMGTGEKVVVLGHGVTGNKDRPFLVALAEGLGEAGFATLRVSWSGNGGSEGRFVGSNITKEVSDLGAVLDALAGKRIAYVGHSMGGAVGVIRAATDPRISVLVSLAGMVHTKDFAEREFGMVTPGTGFMWDDPACPLSAEFMADLRGLGSLTDRGPAIRVPWLLVHGSADDVVPIQDSRDMLAKAGSNATLKVLEGANHVFGGDATAPLVREVVGWLRAVL